MSKPSACTVRSNWVIVLQQDDCATDSLETFEHHFSDFAGGLSVESFKAQALRKEEDISTCWVLGNLELSYSADDPFYTLKSKQAEAADLQADEIESLRNRIATLESRINAVYSERNRLAAGFARMSLSAGFNAGVITSTETNWPVVYVDTPNGQMSWHIANQDSEVLCGLPVYNGQWDQTYRAREKAWCVWPIKQTGPCFYP
jgi:hypothetical protein